MHEGPQSRNGKRYTFADARKLAWASLRSGWSFVLVLVLVNALLVHEIQQLIDRFSESGRAVLAARLDRISGLDLEGQFVVLPISGEKQYAIFALSANCGYCRALMPTWISVADRLDSKQWTVVWVSRDSLEITRRFAHENGLGDSLVLSEVPHQLYFGLGLAEVPRTLRLSGDGDVMRSALGAIDAATMDGIFGLSGERTAKPGGLAARISEPNQVGATTARRGQ